MNPSSSSSFSDKRWGDSALLGAFFASNEHHLLGCVGQFARAGGEFRNFRERESSRNGSFCVLLISIGDESEENVSFLAILCGNRNNGRIVLTF